MVYEILELKEQKYVGIKTVIPFKAHDDISFGDLHDDVFKADIKHIDLNAALMAIDTDFTQESFSYAPLVPVDSFDDNEAFYHFTRSEGSYYAFQVSVEECNPDWFGRVFKFVEKEGLKFEKTGYDLEYYDYTYETKYQGSDIDASEKMLKILFKKV